MPQRHVDNEKLHVTISLDSCSATGLTHPPISEHADYRVVWTVVARSEAESSEIPYTNLDHAALKSLNVSALPVTAGSDLEMPAAQHSVQPR
jgi:hypothetical protein